MLAFVIFIQIGALGVVMSDINSCPVIQDKIIGKRLPVSWPRVEKNICFQMCLRKCEAMSYCLSINFNRVLLECELNHRKKNDTNELVDDDSYFYAETVRTDHHSNLCGVEICNNYSTCITMPGNRKVCIETDCSESAPEIHVPNGKIVQRTYSPASITYGCNEDYVGYGSIQTINCSTGGKWSPLDYQCEHKNCSESTPVIPNGNIVHRTYFPASITYGCDPNYISHGSNQTINCTVGWDWSPLDYRCSIDFTRLVGSVMPFEGRVEVYKYGSWGTVCDDGFGMSEADVVCRSLGYPGALQVLLEYGNGTGAILMDNVNCLSNERTILDCYYLTYHNCEHFEDVGVICNH